MVSGLVAAPDWWAAFASARLDALVARALHNSPTLAAAEATLRQAQQIQKAQAGSTLYPTVNAKLGVSRNQINSASFGQTGNTQTLYNLYNAGAAVNYNLDLFGGNRRALEALAAQADYQGFQLSGARLVLAGNVVTTVFGQAQLGEQIAANEAILRDQQKQLDIARRRLELGAAAKADVLTLQTQVEQTRATLPPLRNKLEQADHLLAALTGQAPGAADIPRFTLADFTLPTRLPLVVPSELVRQRPDIQASAALLHVATAQYGVAVSGLYPQINLSANLATQALTAGALFGPGSMIWSLAGQLAQPLFNGGLKAGSNATEAGLQAAGANYQQTVLEALRSVADVLRQLDNDAQALQAQAAADTSAQASLSLVQEQYRLGAASYLQLLTAQQQFQQTRIGLIAAQAARLPNPNGELLPGVFATVRITQGQPHRYVTLPNAAVAYNPYGATVFIVKDAGKGADGKPKAVVEQRFITPGLTRGDQVAILKGVAAGETVVTAGQLKLRNGSPVLLNNSVQPSDNPSPQVPSSRRPRR